MNFASSGEFGPITYEIADGKVRIAKSDKTVRNHVEIPAIIEGLPVTSIGDYAFYGCSGLTSITIPNSVISIGREAFYGCIGMKSISIPAAFRIQTEASRLSLESLCWSDGFILPTRTQKPASSNTYHALAKVVIANGFVISAEITQEGAGCVEVPAVTITGGDDSGAEAVAVLTSGRVTSIEIINAGRGYTSAPTIVIDPPHNITPSKSSIGASNNCHWDHGSNCKHRSG